MADTFNMWGWIIIVVIIIATGTQLFYYAMVFSKLAFYKSSTNNVLYELKPVSVIIAARNEYKFLEKNLRGVLEQDYPDFEVIVVNDCSWDDSQKLLEYYQEVYHNLRICQLIEQEKYPTGKKFAITMGIKAAQNNQLLFTDADCEPASNQWLRLMQSKFQNKEIVLGYSPVKKYPGLLNLFIRYEGAFTAMAYFSAAIQKNAFMGVGRNLAYMRDLFFKHKGFASHQHILSGDDDLFINEAANEHNVSIQLHPDSFVYTEPKKTFEDWQRQKTRHVSTGKYYKPKHQLFLGGYYASLFLFYSCLIVAILLRADWRLLASMYAVRFILQTTILYFIFTKLKCINLIWFVPILDLLYLFYITVFGVQSVFVKNKKIW